MAGKKDNGVVAVITDLTDEQAAKITKDIMKSKKKYAPYGRGSVRVGKKDKIAALLQGKRDKLTDKDKNKLDKDKTDKDKRK